MHQQHELDQYSREKYQKLLKYALIFVKTHEDGEDVLQDALVKAYRYYPTLGQARETHTLDDWMRMIVRRCAFNYLRKNKRHLAQAVLANDFETIYIGSANDLYPSEDDELFRQIDLLPRKFRVPLLILSQGNTHDAAAREMNIPVGTVKANVFRARKLLRERLAEQERPAA